VGHDDTLVLHVDDAGSAAGLADALRALHGVGQADASDASVILVTPAAEELLAPAVTRANELGIRIRSVDIREPNLESVFLRLTGRALRD
jgi:ABC-2 type transport system ATP-binding protein